MAKSSLIVAAVVTVALSGAFVPSPPGSVVQNEAVYLTGDGNPVQWRAVTSRELLGSANGTKFYQWHLSLYALRGGAYRLRYQSPRNGGPLDRVTRAAAMKMWFPVQAVHIVGPGQFMQPGVQQLVVQSHQTAADCGAATVTVFASTPGASAGPAVSVGNPCELNATVEHGANGDVVHLSGPYYNASAPMCCPTKANATAVLSHFGGKWTVTPNYFKLYVGRFPP
jgi:hypothetical protein